MVYSARMTVEPILRSQEQFEASKSLMFSMSRRPKEKSYPHSPRLPVMPASALPTLRALSAPKVLCSNTAPIPGGALGTSKGGKIVVCPGLLETAEEILDSLPRGGP